MKDLFGRIPWRRVGLVVAGSGALVLGTFVPVAAPVTALIGPGLIGMALPSEWASAVARVVSGVARKQP